MTSAEGGMIITDDKGLAEQCMLYRDQGKQSFTANVHDRLGSNWRMSEPHAIIGLSHLSRLADMVSERRRIAGWYDEALKGIDGIRPLASPAGSASNYYKYIALLDAGIDRTALKKQMREQFEVGLAGEVYELPCHRQPLCAGKHRPEDFPAAEAFCASHVCLPVYNGMTKAEVDLVAAALRTVLGRKGAAR